MKSPITFAKIVATPTIGSWSQAYNAGNLAAVISLTQSAVTSEEGEFESNLSLPSLGKELLNTLEAEYFTLETKNLETIKQAILTTCEKLTGPIVVSLAVAVIIENILYVYLYGEGKVLMKRAGRLGTLLKQSEEQSILSGSGFIENGDIIILETPQFEKIVPEHMLLPCLEHDKLSEMAEILSPVIHKEQEGGAAALAFSYKEDLPAPTTISKDEEKPLPETLISDDFVLPEEVHPQKNETKEKPYKPLPLPGRPAPTETAAISHPRKLFLTIAIILAVVLVASVYFAIKKQQAVTRHALFESSIVPAQKKYDEGQSLMDLNKSLARDDFQSAKQMIQSVMANLPPSSQEAQEGQALLGKINDALNNTAAVTSVNATPVDLSVSPLLSAVAKNSVPYAATDGTTVFLADNSAISSVKTDTQKIVIKNSGDWKTIGGFGVYLGNFYLLDTKDGIIKYAGETTPKTNYLASGVAPDFTKATDLAIDGSIWVLTNDGSISKFTKGAQDQFTLKGLDKPFVKPTRIVTSVDDDNVYILDNGNKRIVVFDKTGNFLAQYESGILGSATAIDVHEKDKKIYVLNSGKAYEIDIK